MSSLEGEFAQRTDFPLVGRALGKTRGSGVGAGTGRRSRCSNWICGRLFSEHIHEPTCSSAAVHPGRPAERSAAVAPAGSTAAGFPAELTVAVLAHRARDRALRA